MPGYKVSRAIVKNPSLFDKYQCPQCHLLLRDAVHLLCSHWLCDSCAVELFAQALGLGSSLKCPRLECQENLCSGAKEVTKYIPDQIVRREINAMILYCPNQNKGCNWVDSLGRLEAHLKICDFTSEECPQCGTVLTPEQMESHQLTCPKAIVTCPLAEFGCSCTQTMTREELEDHIHDHGVRHLETISEVLRTWQPIKFTIPAADNDPRGDSLRPGMRDITNHSQPVSDTPTAAVSSPLQESGNTPQKSHMIFTCQAIPYQPLGREPLSDVGAYVYTGMQASPPATSVVQTAAIDQYPSTTEMSETGDQRSIELGLYALILHDRSTPGTTVWKIPELHRRLSDAKSGRNGSMSSMPFYTSPQGYKMCLRVYLNGDGIGKNSHMSLFFVIMKGEFDNILLWPFTHKVTIKLINQTGGRDIINIFQPDPMSISFRKPKSSTNNASGCPCFVSHTELKNRGFIIGDSIFIKFIVEGQA